MPTHRPFPQTAPIVRTQIETNLTVLGSHVKKAQTMSFVERGFEKLGLDHQVVSFSWRSYKASDLHPWSLSPGGGLGGSGFWSFFPARSIDYSLFLLY